jgi:formamidopyrimidine-DNA glycosylase
MQEQFPGVGNWMADEILWQARLDPRMPARSITDGQAKTLWRMIRFVCRTAIKSVSRGYSAFPHSWLFHERWGRDGRCPRDRTSLVRETVGGRTTAWCRICQPGQGAKT